MIEAVAHTHTHTHTHTHHTPQTHTHFMRMYVTFSMALHSIAHSQIKLYSKTIIYLYNPESISSIISHICLLFSYNTQYYISNYNAVLYGM